MGSAKRAVKVLDFDLHNSTFTIPPPAGESKGKIKGLPLLGGFGDHICGYCRW